jgi:RNA polymerase sigma factor (sigma-70 family)
MNFQRAAPQTDALLVPFLNAAQGSESENVLGQLLSAQAAPIIKGIIREKLRLLAGEADLHGQDAEDVYSDVVAQVLARLDTLRSNRSTDTIQDFRSYVATATFNACHQYLRRKYPQRSRLKNRIRYALTHRHDFAIWEITGKQLCGFAAWRDQTVRKATNTDLRQLRDESARLNEDVRALPDLLAAIFKMAGAPIEIDELVTTVADLQGISDRASIVAGNGEISTLEETLPDPSMNVAGKFERRSYMQRLWSEIAGLPLTQRQALLLNLKDLHEGVIALLPLTGAATFRDIAAALAMTAEDLADLWNKLPLDDATIAERLGLTRQQVINLRKSARARLARRMKAYDKATVIS